MYSKKNRSISPRHRSESPTNKSTIQFKKISTDKHSKYKYAANYRRSIDNSCNQSSSSDMKSSVKHKLESNECWRKSVNMHPSTSSEQQQSIHEHSKHQHQPQQARQPYFRDKLYLDHRFFVQQNIKDPSGQTNTVNYRLDDPDNFQIIRRNDEGKTTLFKHLDEDDRPLNAPIDKRKFKSSSRLQVDTSGETKRVSRHKSNDSKRISIVPYHTKASRSKSSSRSSRSTSSSPSSSSTSSGGYRHSRKPQSSLSKKHERRYKKYRKSHSKSTDRLKEKYKYRHTKPSSSSSTTAASSSKNIGREQYRPSASISRQNKTSTEKSSGPHSPEKTPYFSNPVRERERIDRERREREMLHNNLPPNKKTSTESSSSAGGRRQSRNYLRHGPDDDESSNDPMLQYGLMSRAPYRSFQPIVLPPMQPQIVFVRPPPPHMMRFPPGFHPPPPGFFRPRPPPSNVPPPYYPYWCGPPLPMPPPPYGFRPIRGQSSHPNSFNRNARGDYKKT